jgi:ATP-dependent DNA helicase RecQ
METPTEFLKSVYGYESFREGQEDIINAVLAGKRTLGIMPTGGGKSLTYQIPALMLPGVTIIISPLISLMKNQVDELVTAGVEATMINSSLDFSDLQDRMQAIEHGIFKMVFIAPERLEDPSFYNLLRRLPISLVVIDEVHVLSQWGHDFRPSYMRAVSLIEALPQNPNLMALTATATDRVREDLERLLRIDFTVKTGFARENLAIKIEKGLSDSEKRRFILNYVKDHEDEVGIVYAGTRKKVDELTDYLAANGVKAGKYHAGMSDKQREQAQDDFLYDQIDVIVATNAFGMGINKTNVRYVLHYTMPGSIEAYYQEIGRAGRDGLPSESVLLYSPADIRLQRFFIDNSDNTSPEYRNVEYKKLQEMTSFGATQMCLQRYIIQYFGEDMPDCGRCTNCIDDRELIDVTQDAQKVLSNVYRMTQTGRSAGKTSIVQVLRGKLPEKMAWTKFDEIPTYGLMANTTKKSLDALVDYLTADGYLDVSGEYNSLSVSQAGAEVLKGQRKVMQRQPKPDKQVVRIQKAVGGALFEKLREKRLEIAKELGRPPFMVFSDQTLMNMASVLPTNQEELLSVSGVGQVKAKQYGEDFLAVITEFQSETE